MTDARVAINGTGQASGGKRSWMIVRAVMARGHTNLTNDNKARSLGSRAYRLRQIQLWKVESQVNRMLP